MSSDATRRISEEEWLADVIPTSLSPLSFVLKKKGVQPRRRLSHAAAEEWGRSTRFCTRSQRGLSLCVAVCCVEVGDARGGMLRYYDLLEILGVIWRPSLLTSEHSTMHDDPKHPQNANNTTPDVAAEQPQEREETSTIISFLEHLARRQPYQPRTQSPQKMPAISENSLENELGDASEMPEQKWPEHNPSPDQLPPWSGQVVSLEEIRRLRQHAADANLPTNPLLRYLFEHLMPNYQGGPVNLNVQPEFLQEHARPLLSLLLQSVADSLDGKRKTQPPSSPEMPPSEPASQLAQAFEKNDEITHTGDANQAAPTPPPATSPETPPAAASADVTQTSETSEEGVILKKNVSFSLDLGKIFKQFFSTDKNTPTE